MLFNWRRYHLRSSEFVSFSLHWCILLLNNQQYFEKRIFLKAIYFLSREFPIAIELRIAGSISRRVNIHGRSHSRGVLRWAMKFNYDILTGTLRWTWRGHSRRLRWEKVVLSCMILSAEALRRTRLGPLKVENTKWTIIVLLLYMLLFYTLEFFISIVSLNISVNNYFILYQFFSLYID